MLRIVADLGNSRLKWAKLASDGSITAKCALDVDDDAAWRATLAEWLPAVGEPSSWAISSVNPPLAERLRSVLAEYGGCTMRWYRSAADTPVQHVLEQPETAGADRALAVFEAAARMPGGQAGLVVSCGSAVVVDRVSAAGVWEGGAIAPGLGLAAKALHRFTAQLPAVVIHEVPPPFGAATRPAIEAGVFWGTVGAIGELLERQSAGLPEPRWSVWTGGDAARLAIWVDCPAQRVDLEPDLVLLGLARAAFGTEPP